VGVTRPYSMWLSGEYPRALDGLCKILSLDIARDGPCVDRNEIAQVCWTIPSRSADFMAFTPVRANSRTGLRPCPTSARLIIHRLTPLLGILDEEGLPGAGHGAC